ncbi:MAG: signal peptide peptidase SppA [Micropepsaceae bacterium]
MVAFLGAVFGWIGRRFLNAFAVLGTIAALIVILVGGMSIYGAMTDPGLPPKTILAIDARGGFSDSPTPVLFGQAPLSFIDVIFALKKATADQRVKGILLHVGQGGIAGAHAQELKQAIEAFRAGGEGRFVIAQAGSFSGPGIGQYYVASLADEIWLQPTSEMNAVGMLSTTVFLRGLFDKLSVKADIGKRYEFKNAANVYTETDYTPAHREATTRLLQSIYDTLTADIAASRKMDGAAFRSLLDNAPYLTQGAVDAKLADRIGFYDDAEAAAKERAGDGSDIVPIEAYYAREGSPYAYPYSKDGAIALIAADGAIVDGASGEDSYNGRAAGGETIASAVRAASDDPRVKAILLRVNSPGGSALASDVMLDALRKAQGRGKKVVVSMGPVAASGGYWISMYADVIFASPATITGSIGVLSGKVMLRDTYRLAGLNPVSIGIGANADMYSEFADWTPEQRAKFEATLDQIYARFTAAVAEGRKIPLETVQQIARGRVWSGVDAIGLKLIDRFGGLSDALDETIKLAGFAPGALVDVQIYPQLSAWDNFWATLGRAASTGERLTALVNALDSDAARTLFQIIGPARGGDEVRMTPVEIR